MPEAIVIEGRKAISSLIDRHKIILLAAVAGAEIVSSAIQNRQIPLSKEIFTLLNI